MLMEIDTWRNENLPPVSFDRSGKIRHERPQRNAIEQVCVLWNSVPWKPYFTYERNRNFPRISVILRPIYVGVGTRDFYESVLETMGSMKTYFTEGHKWIPVFPFHVYCQICFEEICLWTQSCAVFMRFTTNTQVRPYSSYGRKWNYIYACTVKTIVLLKVHNALVKSVYCITE
jgi:hypothetical protein